MTRLLLAPIALVCLMAGALPLAAACIAATRGLHDGFADPALAPALHEALVLASLACLPALALGLAGAVCIRRAAFGVRAIILSIAIVMLIVPAPPLDVMPAWDDPSLSALARLACAIARGAALVVLIAAPAASAIDPRLRLAALAAGARPVQAWRHTVLAPLILPALAGLLAAFLAALTQTGAAAIVRPHLDIADAWIAPASLLLVACSATALAMVLQRRR